MSDDHTSRDQIRPLAQLLFGWAFMFKRGGVILVALGLAGAALIAAEIAAGRAPLDLPFEDMPGFYGAAGALVVIAILGLAYLFNAILHRLPAPGDEA
jgi:hypothetical protein